MKKLAVVLVLVLLASIVAVGQDKASVFAGYQYMSLGATADGLGSARVSVPKGFDFDVAGNVAKNVAIVGDLGTGFKDGGKMITFAGGPRFLATSGKVTPFAETLLGVSHFSGGGDSSNNFTFLLGGGLDVSASKNVAIRLAKFDYEYVKGNGGHLNNLRYATGIVFKF